MRSLIKKAIGWAVGKVFLNQLEEDFREGLMRLKIRQHVKQAKAVEKEVKKNQPT